MNNSALMIWSVLFGAIGMGFFAYGSRQKAIVPWMVGTGLMIDPWFITNAYLLVAADLLLIGLAWFIRI
ncbi:hypothetical protein [Salinisphaera hydrothermalis]|uniref:Uncharacterized protein n=1 Tax=Salinisphaera hydrothermalis (strain C41B8) TaxID=1304275 RepID=A0A084IKT3_SALHC|nr:hypothetical protein [Salinisphaera hydrothermalis]KEZ77317.1 hypothetical protein C41B8_10665 [Salinisphaera hydrothermalis C41B8]